MRLARARWLMQQAVAVAPHFARTIVVGRGGWGICPVCTRKTVIAQVGPSSREHRVCVRCRANSRARALVSVLETVKPNWRYLAIYEPSPTGRASEVLREQCEGYVASVFRPKLALGELVGGIRNENLEHLTFPNSSFDVVITQDVVEHLFNPEAAFQEIARVLRTGGVHIFTVPLHLTAPTTQIRAAVDSDGAVKHLLPAQYHDDPFDTKGSLVTVDWGSDITELIDSWSEVETQHMRAHSPSSSRDVPVDVFVSKRQ